MKKKTMTLSLLLLAALLGYGQQKQEQPLAVREKNFSDSIENNYQFEKVYFVRSNPNVKILHLVTPKRFPNYDDFFKAYNALYPLLKRIGKSYAETVLQNSDIEVHVYFDTDKQTGAFSL
jgi:hypothetical protein